MKTFNFSNNDQMPALGLGTWKSKPGEVYHAVREALKMGYRHVDCAAIYGNEKEIGQAFNDIFKQRQIKRESVWITSKIWNSSHLAQDVRPALEKTLKDLQLDYLDLYLMHWPVALRSGVGFPESEGDFISLSEIPISVTWKAMEVCVKAGLTRHIGVSNFTINKLKDLLTKCEIRPEVNQIELQPFLAQNDMLEFCNKENIVVTAYSPLGSTDRPAQIKAPDEPNLLENPTIVEIAQTHGYTPAQVLLRWAVQRGTSVIPKSVNARRMIENLAAATIELTEEDMKKIGALDRHERILKGAFWYAPDLGYTMETLWDE